MTIQRKLFLHALQTALIASVCVLGFSNRLFAQAVDKYQVIKLDERYNNVQVKGAPEPVKMVLSHSDGFILDCSTYDFTTIRGLNKGKYPDFLFIITKGGKYKVVLTYHGSTTIDKTTMISIEGLGNDFTGFAHGDTPILAIGTMGTEKNAQMLAFWATMLELKH